MIDQKELPKKINTLLDQLNADNNKSVLPKEDLLQILIKIQDKFSCIPNESIADIARHFNITRAEVFGVISFYDDLKLASNTSNSTVIIKVCQAEACQAMGVRELMKQLEDSDWLKKQSVEIQKVYCLGNCALAPAIMINDECYGNSSFEQIKELVS